MKNRIFPLVLSFLFITTLCYGSIQFNYETENEKGTVRIDSYR